MITAEARELRFAIDTNSVGRIDVEKAIDTIEKQAARIEEYEGYVMRSALEHEAKNTRIERLIKENVEAVHALEAKDKRLAEREIRILKLETQLLIEHSVEHTHGQIAALRWVGQRMIPPNQWVLEEAYRLEATLKP